ncbi:uncharacterized protein BX663DRAFT_581099 [Cokeromyces recurvatus]|uniref:uncharacterized protein n=1 Tax=Cokeromyces recurvatus TaxID=90255 RepID=UPI0022205EE4|nr:uncharacterized protein BX663DRAFT_581099 [Cokeromyces recurvatus]KAI7906000.1 hypothetical protein BX663DRAFT_581099 [Cokeromyces recurvatus]
MIDILSSNFSSTTTTAVASTTTTAVASTTTSEGYAPQVSPTFPNLTIATGVVTSYDGKNKNIDTSKKLSKKTLDLTKYPTPWTSPDTNHPEVQDAIKKINWDLVPKISVRTTNSNGSFNVEDYDMNKDPDCWWSVTNCLHPKVKYIPDDIYTCPTKGQWGLTYDDGPFNLRSKKDKYAKKENKYAEPVLYNFLAKEGVKSNLFYIGSNVVTYPAAAKRALNDGHYICVHTWSHPTMTTQSNEKVVAELYWTLRAIKEATGVTPKCWRPPQGDVDDRVRSIAWQMGLRTVIWDKDSVDWDIAVAGGGNLKPSQVSAKFKKWIKHAKSGKNNNGTIVLEHELSSATVKMTQKWLPKIKKVFKVLPALACNNITQPYWETSFNYPLDY